MSRSEATVTVEATEAETFYSDPVQPPYGGGHLLAVQAKREADGADAVITIQGGWTSSDPDVTTDWVDLDLVVTTDANGLIAGVDTSSGQVVHAGFPVYRAKVVADGAGVYEIRFVFFT